MPPTIFDGTQSKADDFMGQFQRFKLVNRLHEAMKIPFDQVLTALTYIWGPLINDWVDQQEKQLATQTDTTKCNHVQETDKTLWSDFETAFLNTWTDTLKKQNAYDQLMRLTMNGWDIDTYITMFDCLALVLRFISTELLHKQHYYQTASFLYRDPTSPHLFVFDLRVLLSTIQGLVSLYFSIGDLRTIITV